jgi:hypothetical protein
MFMNQEKAHSKRGEGHKPGRVKRSSAGFRGDYTISPSSDYFPGISGETLADFEGNKFLSERDLETTRMSDSLLYQRVCDRLNEDFILEDFDLGVHVEGGIVTLDGVVANYDDRRYTQEVIDQIEGVEAIINNIEVRKSELL